MGHALMENRHGLVVQADATEANGTAERKAALEMIDRQAPGTSNQLTLGADKAYDAREFVADLRQKCVTPHVAQKARSSAIDGRTTRHAGYAVSQRKRKLVEEAFGWAKTIAGCAKVRSEEYRARPAHEGLTPLRRRMPAATIPSADSTGAPRRRSARGPCARARPAPRACRGWAPMRS